MARCGRTPLRALGGNRSVFAVRFWPDTASDPSTVYGDGVVSVTHLATGRWTVKFFEPVYKVVGASVSVGLATETVAHEESVEFTNEGTSTPLEAIVSYGVAGTLADLAADTNNWISLVLQVEQSGAR